MSPRSVVLFLFALFLLLSTEHAIAGSGVGSLDASTIFLEPPMFGSGGYANNGIAVADVNGDGKPDALVINQDGTVGVLLGNADGSFQPAVIYYSGGGTALAVADLNADGKPDLAVSGGATVSVLLGKGDGTFQPPVTYGSGGQNASSISIGDLNGDGKPDLVAGNLYVGNGNYSRGSVGLLLGNGDGTFQGPAIFDSGGDNAYAVAVSDVSADGKLDLLVANRCSDANCTSGGVAVFLGKGDGSFQSTVTYLAGGLGSDFVTVADVNGDGKLDLLVANHDSPDYYSNGTVGVLLGNGDGTFQPAASYTSGGAGPRSLAVGDVNGDGKPDLLVTNECSNRNNSNSCTGLLSVLFGGGDGSFQPPLSYSSGGIAPNSIVLADMNGDAKLDVLISNQCASLESGCVAGTVSIFLATGNGAFSAAINYPSGGRTPNSVAVADVNGDGKPDVVLVNQCGSGNCTNGTLGILFGRGDGTFDQVVSYSSGGSQASWVAVADVNGDGRPDLLVDNQCADSGNCANGTIGILLQNSDGSFQTGVPYASGGYYAISLGVSDVNGDGKPDLVVANQCATNVNCANGIVGVLLGNGDGTFQSAITYSSAGMFAFSIAIADVNRDGKPDLAITNEYESSANQSNGTSAILLGNGDGTFQPARSYRSGGRYAYTTAVADVNRDGNPDLLITNQCPVGNSCVSGELGILLGNGDGTFQTAAVNSIPQLTGVQQLAVADFDGNGTLDIASGAGDFLLLGKGDGTFQPPLILGADGPGIAVGDFNGDGKPDLAVGGVTILLNAMSRSTATTTNLVSSLNPSGYGQQVTFTATVNASGGGIPTGSITFTDGGNSLGVVALAGGSASFNTSALTAGPHSVVASYTGDSNFNPSTSSAVAQNVNRATTSTALSSSPNPSYLKQSVTFTASVSGQFAGAVSGSVTFKQGATTLATVSLSNGRATYSTTYTSVSTRSITAVYSGDSNDMGSTSPVLNQVVTRVPTSTAVTSSLNPSLIGDAVTFTATVTASNTSLGLPAPTGTVTFKNGGAVLGTSPLNGSSAMYTTNLLPAGTLSITATYNSDSSYLASTSPKLTQTVRRLPTTASLSVNVNPSTYGQTIQFTATIALTSGTGTPTGTVTFKSGTAALATLPLNNGVAIYNNSNLAVGTKSITAVYNGDSVYASSTSPVVSQVINKAASTMMLTSSLNPSTFGTSVTFTASVTPQYSGTPTGSVTFKRGTTILGTVTLNAGVATYMTSTLPKGADQITATYNGSVYFIGSTATITENVQ